METRSSLKRYAGAERSSGPSDGRARYLTRRRRETFLKSKIDLELRQHDQHRTVLGFYKELLRLRRETASLNNISKTDMEVRTFAAEKMLLVRRWKGLRGGL